VCRFVWSAALLYLAVMEFLSALAVGRLDWCPFVVALCDDWCLCLPGDATLTVIKHRAAVNIRLLPQNQTLIKMVPDTRSREENTAEILKRGANVACKKWVWGWWWIIIVHFNLTSSSTLLCFYLVSLFLCLLVVTKECNQRHCKAETDQWCDMNRRNHNS